MPEAATRLLVQLTEQDLERVVNAAVERAMALRAANEQLLSSAEVGEIVGASAKLVQQWARRDGLPFVQLGREQRFRLEDVRAWLEERTVRSGAHVTKHVDRLRKLDNQQ